jgi:hypothetical protein
MVAWLAQTAGGGHAVLSSTAPGLPDTMRVTRKSLCSWLSRSRPCSLFDR